jgi:hypothetical protein
MFLPACLRAQIFFFVYGHGLLAFLSDDWGGA